MIQGRWSDNPPAVLPWARLVPRDIPFMIDDPVYPARIERVEENLDIANRIRSEDLSTALSMVGQPVRRSRLDGAEHLLREDGETIAQCTWHPTEQSEGAHEGVYDPSVTLDFGCVISAYPEIKISGAKGGMIEIGYAERLIDGYFNNSLEGQFANRYTMKDGEQTYAPFTWISFRYLKIRFRGCKSPVKVHWIRARLSMYPFENRGAFQSGDETLNAVFEISRATLRLGSNEFLMDTPWREQAQWLGDVAAVTVPAIYACFGDPRLPGKFIRQAAANQHQTGMISNISNAVNLDWQHAIPDYSLWWVIGLWTHYMYTGEERWLHEFYPEALRVIHGHFPFVNANGLIENMTYWAFVDWANVDLKGECAAYNAIFYGALQAMAKIARFKGDSFTARRCETAMQGIKANLQKRLWDAQRGCLADANVDGQLSRGVSEQGNFAPILWGLCDEDATRKIISTFYEAKTLESYVEAQPFFMVVVLNALDRAGRFDLALELIRDRWGKRMVARGATSVYEEWSENGSWRSGKFSGFLRTHSHAWSACPAEFLIRNLMGLEIAQPGCRQVRLNPKKTPFEYSAKYAAPQGEIEVEWKNGALAVKAPDGIEVVVP
ncbi:MAG: Bacterial alpha-L-rhamnosidase [candidate division BRC1 bacterium ADurb.BinA364]|nr:MAG: Bacterial alpha-L-rhamnosidase [candidate division BRC1 bacterium ADurb.BinA364]